MIFSQDWPHAASILIGQLGLALTGLFLAVAVMRSRPHISTGGTPYVPTVPDRRRRRWRVTLNESFADVRALTTQAFEEGELQRTDGTAYSHHIRRHPADCGARRASCRRSPHPLASREWRAAAGRGPASALAHGGVVGDVQPLVHLHRPPLAVGGLHLGRVQDVSRRGPGRRPAPLHLGRPAQDAQHRHAPHSGIRRHPTRSGRDVAGGLRSCISHSRSASSRAPSRWPPRSRRSP